MKGEAGLFHGIWQGGKRFEFSDRSDSSDLSDLSDWRRPSTCHPWFLPLDAAAGVALGEGFDFFEGDAVVIA